MATDISGQRLDPPVDPDRDHILGADDAPITLVEYGSYACPHCRAAHGRIIDIRDQLGDQLAQLMFPQFDTSEKLTVLGRGMSASPGAAVGKAVFDSYTAVKWSRSGEKVILVRIETSPDDFHGMAVAQGILTARGASGRQGRASRSRSSSSAAGTV